MYSCAICGVECGSEGYCKGHKREYARAFMRQKRLRLPFKFFTTPYGPWPYHLVPYHTWRRGYSRKRKYQEIIIDPGVLQLQGQQEYKYINEYPLKVKENQYWVCPDYPSDVGPDLSPKECIQKSWANILKWQDEFNVILSVQYLYENVDSFKENYRKLYPIANYIGIGNLCHSKKMPFLTQVINYVLLHNPEGKPVHFFGLYKPAIQYLVQYHVPFDVSVDNMKWDYGMHNPNRTPGTYGNTKAGRWEMFGVYCQDLQRIHKQLRLVA
jgi:hypothetical protein